MEITLLLVVPNQQKTVMHISRNHFHFIALHLCYKRSRRRHKSSSRRSVSKDEQHFRNLVLFGRSLLIVRNTRLGRCVKVGVIFLDMYRTYR